MVCSEGRKVVQSVLAGRRSKQVSRVMSRAVSPVHFASQQKRACCHTVPFLQGIMRIVSWLLISAKRGVCWRSIGKQLPKGELVHEVASGSQCLVVVAVAEVLIEERNCA
eukprot:1308263-Amphidinium_carterae.1